MPKKMKTRKMSRTHPLRPFIDRTPMNLPSIQRLTMARRAFEAHAAKALRRAKRERAK